MSTAGGDGAGILVVGACLAGVSTVDALRRTGYDGPITMIGAERHGPYARPPLSKQVLTGTQPPESVLLPRPGDGVTVRSGVTATGLDPARHVVALDDGDEIRYGRLVIATGSRARRLDGTLPAGHPAAEAVLRTLDDAVALRERLATAGSVVVVGGGFLGMEIASAARGLGLDVTVVDVRPPLAALGPFLAAMFERAAREHGVRIHLASGAVRPVRAGDRLAGVDVGGTLLEADLVITAIGDVPNVEWLRGSGVAAEGGVLVDERCRVRPDIVAAGDVARMTVAGRIRRMPFWSNAVAQAQCAAQALLHGDGAAPYHPEPYFWTDAFGLAAKVAGQLPVPGEPDVLAGSPAARSALLRWATGDVVAAAAVNHPVSRARLRRLAAELTA